MQEYTIYPLVVGANETDQGIMTYLRNYGKRIWMPMTVSRRFVNAQIS